MKTINFLRPMSVPLVLLSLMISWWLAALFVLCLLTSIDIWVASDMKNRLIFHMLPNNLSISILPSAASFDHLSPYFPKVTEAWLIFSCFFFLIVVRFGHDPWCAIRNWGPFKKMSHTVKSYIAQDPKILSVLWSNSLVLWTDHRR